MSGSLSNGIIRKLSLLMAFMPLSLGVILLCGLNAGSEFNRPNSIAYVSATDSPSVAVVSNTFQYSSKN